MSSPNRRDHRDWATGVCSATSTPATRTIRSRCLSPRTRILPVLDEWLRKLSSKNLKVTVAAMMEHTGVDGWTATRSPTARIMASQAQTKLDRYMDAIEKGMDPALYVERSRTAQRELAAATCGHRRTLPCRRTTRSLRTAPRSVGACRRRCRASPAR